MLILVAVTISMAINGGLFDYAGKAVSDTQNAIDLEQQLANGKIKIGDKWYASIDDYINNNPIETGIEVTPTEIALKKNEEGAEGTEVLTGTITASVFGMENEPQITWVEASDAITLSATTGKSVTVTAVGTENAEATVTAKCTYEGKEYTQACKVTLEIIEKEEEYTPISTTDSYVGYYADIDGVEGIDGIIYADLARGNTNGEKWADDDGVYSIPVETGLKEYYVSGTATGPFGTEPIDVIKAVPGTAGKDRFYVMALENVGSASTYYHWYYAASGNMSDYKTATSGDFGKGKENTTNMIAKWDKGAGEGGYGAQNTGSYKDIWGEIKSQVSNGWFVPSRGEWAAFAQELGITSSNYTTYGLSGYYWSSSQGNTSYAWYATFYNGYMDYNIVNIYRFVRLSATF